MALEISGCCGRAFSEDGDPDYRGLLARVIFKEVHMRNGNIVVAKLNEPLTFFRQWEGEKLLGNMVDLVLSSPLGRPLVDGGKKQPLRQASLSKIQDDLLRLQEMLTPEEEAEIESCYHELCRQGLLLYKQHL
jgi:hypothetical protein